VSDYNNFWHRIVSSQYASAPSKDGFISHLSYLVQLPYLGKLQNTQKTTNLAIGLKQHIVLWINYVTRYFIHTYQ